MMNLQQRVAFLTNLAEGHDPEEPLKKEVEARSASFQKARLAATDRLIQQMAAVKTQAQTHLHSLESCGDTAILQENLAQHAAQVKRLSEIQKKLLSEISATSEDANEKIAQLQDLVQEVRNVQELLKSFPCQYKKYEKMVADLGERTCVVLRGDK